MEGSILDRIVRGASALAALLGFACGVANADTPAATSGGTSQSQ